MSYDPDNYPHKLTPSETQALTQVEASKASAKVMTVKERRKESKMRRVFNKMRRVFTYTPRFNDPDRFVIDAQAGVVGIRKITYRDIKAERLFVKNNRRALNGLEPLASYQQV